LFRRIYWQTYQARVSNIVVITLNSGSSASRLGNPRKYLIGLDIVDYDIDSEKIGNERYLKP
jgi:hypothetical protein